MIKVNELVESYTKKQNLKNPYDLKKHVVKSYLPHSEKLNIVKKVIDATSYVEINGKKVYKRSTAAMTFLFTIAILIHYTDLDIDTNNINAEYDLLAESGVLTELMDLIPDREVTILKGMLDMERDDLEFNTRSLVAFLETKAEAMMIATEGIAKALEKPEIQAKIEKLMK